MEYLRKYHDVSRLPDHSVAKREVADKFSDEYFKFINSSVSEGARVRFYEVLRHIETFHSHIMFPGIHYTQTVPGPLTR